MNANQIDLPRNTQLFFADGGDASDAAVSAGDAAAVRGEGGGGRAAAPLVVFQPRLQAPHSVRDSVRLQRDKRCYEEASGTPT